MGDLLPLAETCQLLRERYGYTRSNRFLLGVVASGAVPVQRSGREWRIRREDLPQVAQALGLTPTADASSDRAA